MLLQTEEVHQYVVVVVRVVFNSRTGSVTKLRAGHLETKGLLRTRWERIISPVEQHVDQRGTLQIGELPRRR